MELESDQNKRRAKSGRMGDEMKKLKLASHETGHDCECKRLKCFDNVSQNERSCLIKDFNLLISKDEQDSYLCGLISVNSIKQRRSRKSKEDDAMFHDNSYSYKVRVTREGTSVEVSVCHKAFIALHGITKKRIVRLQKSLRTTGKSPKDKRGKHGRCYKGLPKTTKLAVTTHIASFKGRKSHYSLKKTSKIYLPEDLNIKKMYHLYIAGGNHKVSYEFYRYIFRTKFNISFGYPRSDTCSACDEYLAKIQTLEKELVKLPTTSEERTVKENKIQELKIANELHKRKAQAFYSRKTASRTRASQSETIESISIDFQKNLPIPNIATNDVYYCRQLSFYSFNIHVLSTGEAIFYCYTEVIGKKGAAEVVSMLHHFIFNILQDKVRNLEIFCDSCCGQNKNYTMFRYLHYVVTDTRRLDTIKVTFPIRGHSYLECDRNMALINQKRRVEVPEDWLDEIQNARHKPSPFKIVDVDQALLRNWPGYLEPKFVKKCPFPSRPIREIVFTAHHPRMVEHRSTYNGYWETTVIRPRGTTPAIDFRSGEFFLPECLYKGLIPISQEKYVDLQKLSRFVGPEAKVTYKELPHCTRKSTKNACSNKNS